MDLRKDNEGLHAIDRNMRRGIKKLGRRGPAPGTGGRPRIGDSHKTLKATKPWAALGMSERTWYRRQREKRDR